MCRDDRMNSLPEDALEAEQKESWISDAAEMVLEIAAGVVEAIVDLVT